MAASGRPNSKTDCQATLKLDHPFSGRPLFKADRDRQAVGRGPAWPAMASPVEALPALTGCHGREMIGKFGANFMVSFLGAKGGATFPAPAFKSQLVDHGWTLRADT